MKKQLCFLGLCALLFALPTPTKAQQKPQKLSAYFGDLRARSAAKIAIVPRAAVRACLEAQGAMTWSIACAIAIEAIAAVGEMS